MVSVLQNKNKWSLEKSRNDIVDTSDDNDFLCKNPKSILNQVFH